METKTLNQWMSQWGYKWVPNKEQIMKALITEGQAYSFIETLELGGSVTRG